MISFGIDEIIHQNPSWKTKRIGLVTSNAATTNNGALSRTALLQAGFNIVLLFSPEHGITATAPDGEAQQNSIDPITGLSVVSLYGPRCMPTTQDLENIEIVLFDIPDIGARFYTYLWTLTYVLEACALNKKECIVLDRPNPVSGNFDAAEGPFLEDTTSSFIGRWNIPIKHSCTLGELALYFNGTKKLSANLTVIPVKNWDRDSFVSAWGTDFVATSPAIQNHNSMLLYPGLCLLEATNISEGRGSQYSFETAAAPWMQTNEITSFINQSFGDEIKASGISFTPTSGKYANTLCKGIHFEVIDPAYYKPVFFGLLLLHIIRAKHPQHFLWEPYKTAVNPSGENHLDKLLGINNAQKLFDLTLPQFVATCTKITHTPNWQEQMIPYLLY
ncbi:MAG: exo-beta-N-acetylmuramidase NamZ domain-containing protein [Bacteroidota bacterium]